MKPTVTHPEKQHCKHGMAYEPIYRVWITMRSRCNNPNHVDYSRYGGRGIKVCEEWSNFEAFYAWAVANGYKPGVKSKGCTLDRIDVNGNYCPENCRWADAREQANNRRNNRLVDIDGQTKTLTQWAREYGLNAGTVQSRYKRGFRGKDLVKGVWAK